MCHVKIRPATSDLPPRPASCTACPQSTGRGAHVVGSPRSSERRERGGAPARSLPQDRNQTVSHSLALPPVGREWGGGFARGPFSTTGTKPCVKVKFSQTVSIFPLAPRISERRGGGRSGRKGVTLARSLPTAGTNLCATVLPSLR